MLSTTVCSVFSNKDIKLISNYTSSLLVAAFFNVESLSLIIK